MFFSYGCGQQWIHDNKKCRLRGKCLRRIAPAAAMVNEFIETTQNTNKTQLLASNYSTFWALVISENFILQNRPSTQIIDATSFV
jgi:hypothetical protein